MGRYVARRLLQMIPVFIGTTLLIFLMVYILPGDPIRAMWGDKAADPATVGACAIVRAGPAAVEAVHRLHGQRPVPGRLRPDFTGRPVSDGWRRPSRSPSGWPLVAFPIEIVVGIGLGAWAGLQAPARPRTPVSWCSR